MKRLKPTRPLFQGLLLDILSLSYCIYFIHLPLSPGFFKLTDPPSSCATLDIRETQEPSATPPLSCYSSAQVVTVPSKSVSVAPFWCPVRWLSIQARRGKVKYKKQGNVYIEVMYITYLLTQCKRDSSPGRAPEGDSRPRT